MRLISNFRPCLFEDDTVYETFLQTLRVLVRAPSDPDDDSLPPDRFKNE